MRVWSLPFAEKKRTPQSQKPSLQKKRHPGPQPVPLIFVFFFGFFKGTILQLFVETRSPKQAPFTNPHLVFDSTHRLLLLLASLCNFFLLASRDSYGFIVWDSLFSATVCGWFLHDNLLNKSHICVWYSGVFSR